ncbi:ATP12 family chaperone protein [Sedimentitalea nanhaiensis]|uniref:Chaperone required for the assembly of the F1-ATPase n=1 Tax=Sedimentitalea nanhaiensis TaxID=999627 RepID=A0A1I7CN31_9RHOB|nr:ATP12 family protein [Sedimentitalea nanhaiensis]SFU00813.1 Chaperone required for the assembly of the F1-ATPase [Sedimentitalea nanhaiensis]
MSEWKQKRFWTAVTVVAVDDGHAVELDGRWVRTPGKAPLILPSRPMADAMAAEWDAQADAINPLTMPVTRSANSAIDKVIPQQAEVAEMLAAYGDADLLCYRAEAPEELVARQSEAWDPVLDWAHAALGARLTPHRGVIHHPQDADALAALAKRVHAMTPFQLAGFHDLVTLSGSLVLGFAAARGWRDADGIWTLSRLDELWQQEQWGPDEEAQEMAEIKRQAFLHAKRFFDFS